jgi:hypothetical protein
MMLIFMSYFLFPKISSLTCPILILLYLSLLSISQMKHPTTVHHSSTVISPFWMVGPLTPFFSFSSLIRMTLLSCFLWKFRRSDFLVGKGVFQSDNQISPFFFPGGLRLSQWGLGQRTHESAFVSPTEEAQ